jgi:hypothetical protein
MDSSKRMGCLPNTRADVLQLIVDWVNNPFSQQNILWLHGLAGSGKSALSTTIASVFRSSGALGAFLFFERDVTERNDPTIVVRTLAHQLAAFDRRIGTAICTTVESTPNISLSPLSHQFRRLIHDTFWRVEMPGTPIVIVLDALDECGTPDERAALLAVLAEQLTNLPPFIRIFITSRAEMDICNVFMSHAHILIHELCIDTKINSLDILSYFRHQMSVIRTTKKHLRLEWDWPGEKILLQLMVRASGLFVWASTASAFINGHEPRRRLDVILRGEVAPGAEAALDALYKTALESSNLWDDEDFVADFRTILGVVLVAREPLSTSAIDALLHLPEDRPCIHAISLLGCVLQHSPTVRVLHPSFADFLMDKERCGRDMWFFDPSAYHQHLALRCLNRMAQALKWNICNMILSVALTNETLTEDLSYACTFWVDHICAMEKDAPPVVDQLSAFLYQHLLHWFEAMSVLRKSRDTISLLDRLLAWISVS